ncbi:MAG: hypothetical protein M1827_006033 [Pycnora praestabilis]|nr:MAG: hypothetical protein M1827_006033 [Pycnora praestabilis]
MRRSSYQSSGSHQGRSRTNSGISISEACQGLQLSDPSTSLPVSSVPAEPQGESTVEAFGYPPTASSSYLSADFGIDPYAPIPSGSPYLSSHTYTQDTTEEQGWSTFDAPSSSAASKIPIVRLDPDNLAYQSSFGDIEAPRQDSGVGEMRYFGLPGSHYDFNFRYQHPSAMASYDEANHYGGMGMSYASYGSTQAPASQYSRTSLTLADPAATSIYARGISASPTFVSLSPAEREVKRQRRQHSKSGSQRDKGSGSSYHASGESLGMGISDYPAVSVVPSSTIVTSSEGTTYLPQYTGSITSSPYAAEYSSSPGQYAHLDRVRHQGLQMEVAQACIPLRVELLPGHQMRKLKCEYSLRDPSLSALSTVAMVVNSLLSAISFGINEKDPARRPNLIVQIAVPNSHEPLHAMATWLMRNVGQEEVRTIEDPGDPDLSPVLKRSIISVKASPGARAFDILDKRIGRFIVWHIWGFAWKAHWTLVLF